MNNMKFSWMKVNIKISTIIFRNFLSGNEMRNINNYAFLWTKMKKINQPLEFFEWTWT